MQERSSTRALLECKCPRCRQGDLFEDKLSKFWTNRAMHKKCPVCDLNFEPEPGFYYGAMFISYAVSVAIAIVSGVVLYVFFDDPDMWVYFATVLTLTLLLTPASYRYSRSTMLHAFGGISYDSGYSDLRR